MSELVCIPTLQSWIVHGTPAISCDLTRYLIKNLCSCGHDPGRLLNMILFAINNSGLKHNQSVLWTVYDFLKNVFFSPLSLLSDSLIQDLIAARLVLPNRITIPLKKNINIAHLRFPIPYVSVL